MTLPVKEHYLGSTLKLEVEVRLSDGGIGVWKFDAHDEIGDVSMYIEKRGGGDDEIQIDYQWEDIPLHVARAFAGYFQEVVRRHDEYQRHGTPR
jgi:hypothetical protein